LQGGLVCDALQRRLQYMHCMHRNAPQWSASLLQRFRISLQLLLLLLLLLLLSEHLYSALSFYKKSL